MDVVYEIVGMRLYCKLDAIFLKLVQYRNKELHELFFHVSPALCIREREVPSEVRYACETVDYRHFKGIGGLCCPEQALCTEPDFFFLCSFIDRVCVDAMRSHDEEGICTLLMQIS